MNAKKSFEIMPGGIFGRILMEIGDETIECLNLCEPFEESHIHR